MHLKLKVFVEGNRSIVEAPWQLGSHLPQQTALTSLLFSCRNLLFHNGAVDFSQVDVLVLFSRAIVNIITFVPREQDLCK